MNAAVRAKVAHTLVARSTDPATDLRARINYGRILSVLGDPRLTRIESAHGAALVPEFARIPAGGHRACSARTRPPCSRPSAW